MAAKIDRARLQADPSRMVGASAYDKHEHGTALCPDPRCRCVLRFIKGYTRSIYDQQAFTVAHFALPANAEANGRGHGLRCGFNVAKVVAKIVAASRKFTGGELLTDAPSGAEYRLHILMEL